MKDKEKTKVQLQNELTELRQQITKLQKSEIKHQQIEETLRENAEKYRNFFETSTDCIFIETLKGRVLESNTAGEKMFGYNKKDIIGLTIADLVPEEFAKKLPKIITDKETTNGIFMPRISKKKDGTIFPTEIATKIVNIRGKSQVITYIRDITKRKMAEKKLKKARKMFSSLFNSGPEAALYHNNEGRIIKINSRFTELFGYNPKEIIGKKIDAGMIYPENKTKEGKTLTQKASNGFLDYETIRRKKDGTLVPVVISSSPVIIDKKSQGTIGLYRDITKRKKTEEALKKSQKEFAGLFKNSPEALVYIDEKSNILNINPRFTELFGYTLDEIKGINLDNGLIHSPEKIKEGKELGRIAKSTGYFQKDTIRKKKDGTLFPVSIFGSRITIDGQLKGILIIYINTTERKNMLDKLRKSEEKYRKLFENMPGAYYRTDKEGNFTMINPEGVKLFGYKSSEDIIGKNISHHFYFAPKGRKKYLKELEKNNGNLKDFEITLKKKDGSSLVISDSSHYYYDKEGNIAGLEGIFVDITERKKTEEALQTSQQEFSSLFKNSPETLVYIDEKGTIVNINPRFTELFGYTLEEVKGKNIDSGIIHPSGKLEEGEILTKKSLKGYLGFETIRKKKDGTLFPVSLSISNIEIDGKLRGGIGIYIDITGRKKMEKELEKLAHFDTLTGAYNRGYGIDLFKEQLKFAKRKKYSLLLAYIDIDKFKYINDTFGHEEGDKVLKEVVKLFKLTIREIDIIFRIGGDEFLIIFPDSSMDDASMIKKRLKKNLIRLNQKLSKSYKIDFSIGYSFYNPANPQPLEKLIHLADQAMYEDKGNGKNS